MGQRKLIIAGVPFIMAAAYSYYKDSQTSLIGESQPMHRKNFERKKKKRNRNRKYKSENNDEYVSDKEVSDEEDKINIRIPQNRDCPKCNTLEQKLLKYIARNES